MYKKKLIFKIIAVTVLSFWIMSKGGIVGLIDVVQFIEILFGLIIVAVIINKFRISGVAYRAEKSGIIIGIIGMLCQIIMTYIKYGSHVKDLLWFCALSLLYGLFFSTLNTLMIYERKKRDGIL